MVNSLNLAGEGGNSFSFDNVGDSVTGKVVGMEEVQQTDMSTGEPAFWSNGQPKMMYRVDLDTDLGNGPDDDGRRSVYLKGSRKPESKSTLSAVLGAVKTATGSTDLAVGGTLTLTFVGEGERTNRGWNPPKLYTATYQPPSMSLDQQPQQVPAQQVPAQQVPAQQPQQAPAPTPQVPAQDPQQASTPTLTPEMIAALQNSGFPVPGVS